MSWENLIKRGKSYRRRQFIERHNKPIKRLLSELEEKYESAHSELIASSTSTTRDIYGFDKQMEMVKELQDVLIEITKEIEEQKSKIKTLPADKVKGKGKGQKREII
jgi:transposase